MRGFLARKNLRGEFLLSPKPGSQAGRAFVAVAKVGFALDLRASCLKSLLRALFYAKFSLLLFEKQKSS